MNTNNPPRPTPAPADSWPQQLLNSSTPNLVCNDQAIWGNIARSTHTGDEPFKVVLVAAMRKRVTILSIMLKESQPWNPKLQMA